MHMRTLAIAAFLSLAGLGGCDAPAAPVEEAAAPPTQTEVVTLPDASAAVAPPAESKEQVVMATPPPPAKELKQVQFAANADALDDATTGQLSGFARYMAKFRKSVVLTGHASGSDPVVARDLADRRAAAVKRYLVLHDVSATQIIVASATATLTQGDAVDLELGDALSNAN